MIKRISFIFFVACISAQVQYDPLTGELIQEKKFDPNTGKEIEKKKEGITAKVTLTTGDIIQGILVSQDHEKIIIKSRMVGTVTIDRVNIKNMSIGGVPMSTRRLAKTAIVRNNDLPESTFTDNLTLTMYAKNEVMEKNQKLFNYAVGAGACVTIPYITLPAMGVLIAGNVGVSEPESNYYKNLVGPDLQKEYRTIYRKETRKLRAQQCFTPTLVVSAGIAVLIGAVIFAP